MNALESKIAASEICKYMISDNEFVEKFANVLASKMKDMEEIGKYISKNKAYKIFGRTQVDRWLYLGLIDYINNGKYHLIEYKALEELSNLSEQEYERRKSKALNEMVYKK
ncbi:MAG: hypothetical protein PUB21_11840 [Bacteroidales bacterium]|nr:hypothetical protein [Bacteroidales bacterium]